MGMTKDVQHVVVIQVLFAPKLNVFGEKDAPIIQIIPWIEMVVHYIPVGSKIALPRQQPFQSLPLAMARHHALVVYLVWMIREITVSPRIHSIRLRKSTPVLRFADLALCSTVQ